MMVLMGKLRSKLLPLAHVCCPAVSVPGPNDALMVRGYKHMTADTRHADIDAVWGPWGHGYQGLAKPSHWWQLGSARVPTQEKRSPSPRPTLCKLTRDFGEAGRLRLARGTKPTICDAPTSSIPRNACRTRVPYQYRCQATAHVSPRCWCGA